MENINNTNKEMSTKNKQKEIVKTKYVITRYGMRVTMQEWLDMDPSER